MYFIYRKKQKYKMSSKEIHMVENTMFEATNKVTPGPCDIIQLNSYKRHKLTTHETSEAIIKALPLIKSLLLHDEKITIYIEEYYRSNNNDYFDITIVPNQISYYECFVGDIITYENIQNEDFIDCIKRSLNKNRLTYKLKSQEYNGKIQKLPHVFSKKAAATVSHEVFGHILEIDNFYYYNYSKLIPEIESLNICIHDDPQFYKQLGLSRKDDVLNASVKTTLFNEGKFTGELIGGSSKTMVCERSFRRSSFSVRALPRMSTIIITSKSEKINYPTRYILITSIRQAYIHHKTGYVEFNVTGAKVILDGMEISKLSNFSIKMSLYDFLHHLYTLTNTQPEASFFECHKKGQLLKCGIKTNDWILLKGK